ncbi:hypothetical protein [Paenibacillus kyungheensis]
MENDIVVFGVDVGTESAWIEIDSPPGNLSKYSVISKNKKEVMNYKNKSYNIGTNIDELVDNIVKAMSNNKKVAIGFEAPMWTFSYTKNFSLRDIFKERFTEEKNHNHKNKKTHFLWYVSAGASAHTMALPLGVAIFAKLKDILEVKITTNPDKWTNDTILLFEGFFAGQHKIAWYKTIPIMLKNKVVISTKKHLHYWDAFSTASAFWYLNHNSSFNQIPNLVVKKCVELNPNNFIIESLWHQIAEANEITIIDKDYKLCDVVTFQ